MKILQTALKSAEVLQFRFDVQVDYIRGIEEIEITIPSLTGFWENGVNKAQDYNCYAYLTEKLLQEIYDQAYFNGIHPILALVQLFKNKNAFIRVMQEDSNTHRFELKTSRENLLKALDYDYQDIHKACDGAIEYLNKLNNVSSPVEFPAVVNFSSVVIEKALKRTVTFQGTGSLKSALLKGFGKEIESYLDCKELKNLTAYFKEVYMNDDVVSVAVDRKNRHYATFMFDEATMLLMLAHPSMVYIPRYDDRGLAQCRFLEAEVSDDKDIQYGFFESSNMNYRFVVPSFGFIDMDMTEPKFLPCIQFMDSLLSSPNGELKNLHYEETIGANLSVPSKQTMKRIEDFLRRVYAI